ncbi:DUF3293 domain-containing protein [Desertivirga arenae]|uniref:DUF3293 domain-containing protein n=1 Tax=Desertivirga arenae TaxID=2810309 RepID=UPI001A95DA59|nr:DUF3293 domain-containing protein [Pedobacter sp. SYSU D00823]
MIDKNLIEAYQETVFKVYNPHLEIRIDEVNSDLDELLKAQNQTDYAYITAWNPFSQLQSPDKNQHFNELLANDLKEYVTYTGEGVGSDESWAPEESFLVIGISKDRATELAKKYGQNAIVFGTIGGTPELVFLEYSSAERLLAPLNISPPGSLPYLFSKGLNLKINLFGNGSFEGWIDVARSSVELFQNISRLEEGEQTPGMLLVFENTRTPALINLDAPFNFQSVWIKEKENGELIVEKIGTHMASDVVKGPFIQTVAEYRFLLLLPTKTFKLPVSKIQYGILSVQNGALAWDIES